MDFNPATDPAMWVAGLAAAVGTLALVLWGRIKAVQVPRIGRWDQAIVVHATGIDRATLDKAVTYWAGLGYQISTNGTGRVLDVVVDPTLNDAGRTFVQQRGETIVNAIIRIAPAHAGRAVVVAHELGHALGLDHPTNPPTGHVMHHDEASVGWDGRGCRA